MYIVRCRGKHAIGYYEVRHDEWVDGRARHRTIVQLVRFPTIAEAYEHFFGEYLKAKRTGKHAPFSPAQEKAWKRITLLSMCLASEQGAERKIDPRYLREFHRWERHEYRQKPPRKRRERSTLMNPWRVLGVSKRATPEQIRAAYRRKAWQSHPDRGGSNEQMARINAAYEFLQHGNDDD